MYKIYILHKNKVDATDAEKEIFSRVDSEHISLACANENEIIDMASDADAILVHGSEITKKVLESLKKLKVVVRYGVGYENIDIAAAKELGIPVCNVPDYGTHEVASHAMAMILCCHRGLMVLNESVKANKWDYTASGPIRRLSELTLGFAAFGRIAQRASIMAATFNFRLLGYDPSCPTDVFEKHGVEKADFERLITQSDIISCHVPLNSESRHMFNEAAFSKMKKGVIFINTSRGGVVDEEALIRAINDKTVSYAGLDVFEKEPLPDSSPLKGFPNVILTPHSACNSEEATAELKTKAAEEAVRVLMGEAPLNSVVI